MPVFAYIAPVRVEPSAGSWQHKARLPRKRVTVALPAQPAPPQRPPLMLHGPLFAHRAPHCGETTSVEQLWSSSCVKLSRALAGAHCSTGSVL